MLRATHAEPVSPFAAPRASEERAGAAADQSALVGSLEAAEAGAESGEHTGRPELAAPEGAGAAALGDRDIDRIARRVVELLGDKVVRDVAWEVIPDLAEVVIKDRLRELESQIE